MPAYTNDPYSHHDDIRPVRVWEVLEREFLGGLVDGTAFGCKIDWTSKRSGQLERFNMVHGTAGGLIANDFKGDAALLDEAQKRKGYVQIPPFANPDLQVTPMTDL